METKYATKYSSNSSVSHSRYIPQISKLVLFFLLRSDFNSGLLRNRYLGKLLGIGIFESPCECGMWSWPLNQFIIRGFNFPLAKYSKTSGDKLIIFLHFEFFSHYSVSRYFVTLYLVTLFSNAPLRATQESLNNKPTFHAWVYKDENAISTFAVGE